MNRASTGDRGSVAIEFVVCGLLAPILIIGGVLSLASAQRSQIAAQQLAREYVRSQALGESPAIAEPMRQSVADGLRITLDQVHLSSRLIANGQVIEVTAQVNGAFEKARMRVLK